MLRQRKIIFVVTPILPTKHGFYRICQITKPSFQGQDFASLIGGLLGGAGGGGGGGGNPLGGLFAGLGKGGAGGKAPDIASLFSGFLGKGGGTPPLFPMPGGPPPAPAPAPGRGIQGPTNIAIPDYSDYDEKTVSNRDNDSNT
ncbi:unnamed protein product [Strongylus vulgaris]|uniref:Uncharacterized protein n=1 Tax=Strongylus vulgaris TaxID=40348 RepID=A0A3P7IIY5_STRVU|nr:unnamed protein product [Strongylus vulgaris]